MCTHTHLSDCMAGAGRAGTLIGMYLMKHLDFTANEAIGGLRACSVNPKVLSARSASSAPSSKHTVLRMHMRMRKCIVVPKATTRTYKHACVYRLAPCCPPGKRHRAAAAIPGRQRGPHAHTQSALPARARTGSLPRCQTQCAQQTPRQPLYLLQG